MCPRTSSFDYKTVIKSNTKISTIYRLIGIQHINRIINGNKISII